MKLSKRVKSAEYNRIRDFIELLISVHPFGFGILLGKYRPPTSIEVHEMMNSQRDPLPVDYRATQKSSTTEAERIYQDSEYFSQTVDLAGGWEHINHIAREFLKIDKRMWDVSVDHVKYVANPSSRYFSRLEYVANKHGISRNTVVKYRKLFPCVLSMMLLTPDGEKFEITGE